MTVHKFLAKGMVGYRSKPGHSVASLTYRENLTVLPWQRQLVDLR
jgi:hypothetical protein